MAMVILLSIFGPVLAGLVIFALVMFSSFMTKPSSDQQISQGIEPKTLLKLIAKSRVFPVGINNGWKLFSFQHGSRVWAQNFLVEGLENRMSFYTSFCKMPASTQVVFQTIKDIAKTREWKPSVVMCSLVKSPKNDKVPTANMSPHRHDSVMGHDVILEVIINPYVEGYTEEVTPQQYSRYWNREDNGCCWVLQSSQDRRLSTFYLIQPVEDLDSSLVTILVHHTTDNKGANYVSSLLASLKDYLVLRKLKYTPFNSIRMPNFNNVHTKDTYQDSSTDEEKENPSRQKFSTLDAQQKSLVLQMSESILRLKNDSQSNITPQRKQKRSVSDTDLLTASVQDSKMKAQAGSAPVNNVQHSDRQASGDFVRPETINRTNKPPSEPVSSVESSENLDKSEEEEERNPDEDDNVFEGKEVDVNANVEETDSDVSSIDTEDLQEEPYVISERTTSPDTVKYTTLANRCAAELMATTLRVSNIDLRKTQGQQAETSGGWMFWGLESDVVIFKKICNKSCTTYSYLGKGLIQATPQTVFEAIKNPRTRFTYDESLKKVDVLQTVSEKTKVVYFYHELVYMFKKECFDFCVLQNERIDGDKYVLAMESVDTGLPSPSGVERVQMLTSGWVIEPVTKDNKKCAMATYVMQMNFTESRNNAEKAPLEEMITKQPLSIELLRQYLRPAVLLSRSVSSISSATRR